MVGMEDGSGKIPMLKMYVFKSGWLSQGSSETCLLYYVVVIGSLVYEFGPFPFALGHFSAPQGLKFSHES